MGRKKRALTYRFAILGLKLGRNKVKMDTPMEHWHNTDYGAQQNYIHLTRSIPSFNQ